MQFNPGAPRPAIGRTGSSINVDLAHPTNGIWNKGISGVATGGLDWQGQFTDLNKPDFVAGCASIGARFVRTNALGALKMIFGPAANSPPNWQHLDLYIQKIRQAWPQAEFALSLTANWDFDYNNAALRQNIARATQYAVQRVVSGGVPLVHYTPINEPDAGKSPGTVSPASTVAMEELIRAAVHSVLPSIYVGGPCTSYMRGDYMTPVGKSQGDTDKKLISYNYYNHPNTANPPSDDAIWNSAVTNGYTNANGAQQLARAGAGGDYITTILEYNLNWTPGQYNDPRQQNFKGAIFSALFLSSGAYGGLCGGALWRSENWDGSYGPFYTGTTRLNPNGTLLQAMSKYLGGKIMPLTIASAPTGKIFGVATREDDGRVGLMMINWDGSQPWTGPIAFAGGEVSNLVRWTMSAQSEGGVVTTAPNLGAVTLGPASVSIFSGTTAPAPKPEPKPESANGTTIVAPSIDRIWDANGNSWGIEGGRVWVNEQADSTTGNVKELRYVDKRIYQFNGSLWWSKAQPSDAWTPGAGDPNPPRDVAPPEPPPDGGVTAETIAHDVRQAMDILDQVLIDLGKL